MKEYVKLKSLEKREFSATGFVCDISRDNRCKLFARLTV